LKCNCRNIVIPGSEKRQKLVNY